MEKSDEAMLPTEKGEKSKIERLPLGKYLINILIIYFFLLRFD